MHSITSAEFLPFSKLPVELRRMIWDEAVLAPMEYQRFNAEIARHPDLNTSNKAQSLVLCLTPHDEFIQLTSTHRGLLGACHESRAIASESVIHELPINYLAPDGRGSFAVRFARVPFNPDGRVCISGLGPAFDAAGDGHGARSMNLRWACPREYLAEAMQCATIPEVKNLTIALDPARDLESKRLFMLGWDGVAFNNLALRMPKLETVALVDEGVLGERGHMDAEDFSWMHKPARVVRPAEDDDGWDYEMDEPSAVKIPWLQLWNDFRRAMSTYEAIKLFNTR
ncbi:hypothetical protein diail_4287 [Diaporthe ilicicola]|nr:hypothetical protein diail_4287 [Diaporthe ilicicola]